MTTQRPKERPRRGRLRARVGRLDPTRLLSAETVAHRRNASREVRRARRGLLDALIARLDHAEGTRS